jgi:hypothetical protein
MEEQVKNLEALLREGLILFSNFAKIPGPLQRAASTMMSKYKKVVQGR